MDNPDRSIRAPSTIIKSSKPRTYNGPLAQNKFKLLGSLGINPLERTTPQTNNLPQPTTITASSTSRIPLKPSCLARPTPVRHIISAASTTSAAAVPSSSSIRLPMQRPFSSSKPSSSVTKLKELRLQSATKLSTSVRKSTALNTTNPHVQLQQQKLQEKKQSAQSDTVTSSASSSNQLDVSILNSVTGDVGAIRRLLEQLLELLQCSSQETKDMKESYATLEAENEQLRKENAELKCKLRAIKSTFKNNRESIIPEESETHRTLDGRTTSSDLFFTPLH